MIRRDQMSNVRSARPAQHGAVLLGLAGGMLVVAGGLVGGYFIMNKHSVARAATAPTETKQEVAVAPAAPVKSFDELLTREVDIKTATGMVRLKWSELGVELDPDEVKRASGNADALAKTGSLPVRVNRDAAVKALTL